MTLGFWVMYCAFLAVVTGFAVLWSEWPEKYGGWLLATKQKLPPLLRLWHPKQVISFYILGVVLLFLLEYLAYKALKGLTH